MKASDALKKTLLDFTDSLIREKKIKTSYGYYLSITSLNDDELEEFVANLIKYDINQGEPWLWLSDADDKDTVAKLFTQYLTTYSPDIKYDFMASLVHQSIETYKPKMEELINERLPVVYQEDLIESGARARVCRQTGETLWT